MLHRHRRLVALGAALLLSLSVVGSSSAAPTITVLKSGLNNPRGIDVAANGQILVAETGAGRVISRDKKGTWRTVLGGLPVLPGDEKSGVHAVAATGNGNALALIGEGPDTPTEDARFGTLVRVHPAGRQVADIGAHQVTDPDPTDLDVPTFPTQSNAYGLALVGGGKALVTDAGGNDLLLVHPSGRVQTVAHFAPIMQTTSHLPPFLGVPPDITIPGEAVPTGVAVGPDGYWYVGQLAGFPFQPGASRIWRINPKARGVTCTEAATTGPCTVWATGFTSIVAIDFGPDGDLYVVEMVKSGVLNFFIGADDVGALIRVDWATKAKTEIAAGELTTPGGVSVARDGTIYVTNNSVSPTDGQVLRIRQ
jgi:hypothetical protein